MKAVLIAFISVQLVVSAAWAQASKPATKVKTTTETVTTETNSDTVVTTTETKKEVVEETPAAPAPFERADLDSKTVRGQSPFTLGLNYSWLDTWIPSKYGAQFAYNASESSTWEIEYLRGSISVPSGFLDIGSITDQRLTVMHRSFGARNSFNFFWGLVYESLEAKLGSDILSNIGGIDAASVDLLKISTLGISWGMGNRWSIHRNLTFGIDWLAINVPLTTLESETDILKYSTDPDDREDIQDVVDAVEKIPTISILKLQLAYTF